MEIPNHNLEILKNVDAPWEISSSTPFLEIKAFENSPESDNLKIEFNVNFSPDKKVFLTKDYYPDEVNDLQTKVVIHKNGLYKETGYEESRYQRIEVRFNSFYAFKVLSSPNTQSVIDESQYSWELIKFYDLINQDWEEWKNKFRSTWQQTNICPDCSMYEVLNSKWLRETGFDKMFGCKHFLILGHDIYVEVLAKSWKWESIGALTNW